MARSAFGRGCKTANLLLGEGTTTTAKLMSGALTPKFTGSSGVHSLAIPAEKVDLLKGKEESAISNSEATTETTSKPIYEAQSQLSPGI